MSVRVRDEAGQESKHESALVVNCTGPRAGFSETDIPLYRNLIERGLVRSDELDMGIDVATDFAVLDADGEKSKLLFAIGPLMRGSLLETTAVPELRGQAHRVAEVLAADAAQKANRDFRMSVEDEHVVEYYI
ncbi:MAG: putative NAD(P)/FAD-binding protein YdhS [Limisphaerales bacterium]